MNLSPLAEAMFKRCTNSLTKELQLNPASIEEQFPLGRNALHLAIRWPEVCISLTELIERWSG